MSSTSDQASPAAAPASAAPAGTTTTTATVDIGTEEPFVNKDEFVKWAKATRDVKAAVDAIRLEIGSLSSAIGKRAEPAPAPVAKDARGTEPNSGDAAMAEVHKLQRHIALKDAIADLGMPMSKAQRDIVQAMFDARAPAVDGLGEWLSGIVAAMGVSKTTAPPAPSPVVPAKQATDKTDTGPPVADARTALSGDLLKVDGATFRAMKPAEKLEYYKNYMRSRGHGENPIAALKQR